MTDRKYRQRGYQDDGAGRGPRQDSARRPLEPRDPRLPRDPKVPNMPGFREVARCSRCGNIGTGDRSETATCKKCGADLHTCIQCSAFDAGARFECTEPIPARVSPKDARNTCAFFAPRISVERETGSTPASSQSAAKKAFDDLFKL